MSSPRFPDRLGRRRQLRAELADFRTVTVSATAAASAHGISPTPERRRRSPLWIVASVVVFTLARWKRARGRALLTALAPAITLATSGWLLPLARPVASATPVPETKEQDRRTRDGPGKLKARRYPDRPSQSLPAVSEISRPATNEEAVNLTIQLPLFDDKRALQAHAKDLDLITSSQRGTLERS
jgi:hypothetical protein